MNPSPVPGPFRPGGPPGTGRPGASTSSHAAADAGDTGTGHPAVDAVLQAMANAANLPPADQIAQYEAAHQTLRETLATIDQA
ncbi:hypothetical protein [Plantactinospora sp. B5E13]|uniref:hypothetical protein n=1 Tax=unclassified Plantactinospora TaxID=2631981 RepID=UPI00325DFD0E